MKHSKKIITILLILCFSFTLFLPVAFSATSSAKGKVILEFWSFWGSATRRPIIEKMVSDFNKSQNRIFVKYVFVPWGDIWTKNLAAIAAGNPPNAIINDINTVAHRAKNKQNTDLTPFIGTGDLSKRYFPALWKTVLYNGKPYALPFNTDTRLLFYNKKQFKEVGLNPEKPPKTWAELESYAKKLDKKTGAFYTRIGFYPLYGNYGATSWMINADKGRNFITDDGQILVNTPAKVQALEWINKWTNRLGRNAVNAFQAQFGSAQANPFIAGKLSMIAEVATFYTQIRDYGKDMEWGVAPIPEKTPGNGNWSWGGGFVAEIPYGAKHQPESFQFIRYLTDVQAQKYWAIKNFDIVANERAFKDAEMMKLPVLQAAKENMKWTVITPIPIYAPDYLSLINPNIDAALLGKMTPKAALDKAQKAVEDLVAQNKK
ncbi:ABC transporter substrate-binding protein [Caldicellulosiruptoraceae bacterium PP1]